MYEILITESYRKIVLKFFKKHPSLKDKYKKTISLLKQDPFNDALDIKKMSGFSNLYRIKLSYRDRIVIKIVIKKKKIIPIIIDTRENIYRNS